MEYLTALWNVRASRILIGSHLIAALHQIGWLYCCVRLRKDNLKNGYEKVVQNPTYKASLDQFQVMHDSESLNTFYSSAVKEFPEIEKYLTRAYKRQKLQLER